MMNDKNKSESLLNNDRFVSYMLSNIETARRFFKLVLPSNVSELLDFSTLQNERTRLTTPSGKDRFGDFFYTVNLREPSKSSIKRPIFTIILEHKSQDDAEVALQLAEYIIGLIRMMQVNREMYADEDGKLPAPYAIVFSQDWGSKRIYSLKDMLSALPGLEDTIPNFTFQYFRICDITLDEIAQCGDPLTEFFLYLARLLNDPSTDVDEEATQIASRMTKCLATPNPDARMKGGTRTCIGYLDSIRVHRPQTPSYEKVYKKMSIADIMPSNMTLVKEYFNDVYVALENERRRAEAESKKVEVANKKAEAANKKAEAESKAKMEIMANATARFKEMFLRELGQRFPSGNQERLISMINSIDDYYILDKVYDICQKEQTIAEMTDAVERRLEGC